MCTGLQQGDRIHAEHGTVPQALGIFEHLRQSVVSRCRLCNEVAGRHFKHMVQMLMMKCLIIIMLCQCYLCTIKISINYVQDIRSRPETSMPMKTALPVVACTCVEQCASPLPGCLSAVPVMTNTCNHTQRSYIRSYRHRRRCRDGC